GNVDASWGRRNPATDGAFPGFSSDKKSRLTLHKIRSARGVLLGSKSEKVPFVPKFKVNDERSSLFAGGDVHNWFNRLRCAGLSYPSPAGLRTLQLVGYQRWLGVPYPP